MYVYVYIYIYIYIHTYILLARGVRDGRRPGVVQVVLHLGCMIIIITTICYCSCHYQYYTTTTTTNNNNDNNINNNTSNYYYYYYFYCCCCYYHYYYYYCCSADAHLFHLRSYDVVTMRSLTVVLLSSYDGCCAIVSHSLLQICHLRYNTVGYGRDQYSVVYDIV